MLLNCGFGEPLGQQGDPTSQSSRKSVLNIHWKDWCWSWSSNPLATWSWERPWSWERLKAGGEGDNRGWDGWMVSLTRWTWVWASSGSWWWTGRPRVLQSTHGVEKSHTQLSNWTELSRYEIKITTWSKYQLVRMQEPWKTGGFLFTQHYKVTGWQTPSLFYSPIASPVPQFSSVPQLCPTLCNPMNRSMPGLPVHHQLPEVTQTHIHWVSDAIQPSHPLSSPSPPAPNPSQHQSLFQRVNSSHEVAKVLEFQL